ncbi:TetR/AcrR family transcriptional regulator [Paenibacillus periandrae]|uniref:TetR/AcrR family transcriptional regulator n=1 Tax=Paenibacillus periandrae TaxID=1761741 RepID=UPI001F08D8FF|nr:TetR/AcrR family transcriptional regulator [Paenibacillus periandrae]
MEKANDLRVIRTKKLIEDAFLTIMEEQGFEGVTVRSLSQKAGINRGTFYLHYQDIYDLMEKLEDCLIEGMNGLSDDEAPRDLTSLDTDNEPFPLIMSFFDYMNANPRMFKLVFDPQVPSFGHKLTSLLHDRMYAKIPLELRDSHKQTMPPDYLIAYFSSAYFGIIHHWFASGMELSPREMALMITRLIRHGPLVAALKETGK